MARAARSLRCRISLRRSTYATNSRALTGVPRGAGVCGCKRRRNDAVVNVSRAIKEKGGLPVKTAANEG